MLRSPGGFVIISLRHAAWVFDRTHPQGPRDAARLVGAHRSVHVAHREEAIDVEVARLNEGSRREAAGDAGPEPPHQQVVYGAPRFALIAPRLFIEGHAPWPVCAEEPGWSVVRALPGTNVLHPNRRSAGHGDPVPMIRNRPIMGQPSPWPLDAEGHPEPGLAIRKGSKVHRQHEAQVVAALARQHVPGWCPQRQTQDPPPGPQRQSGQKACLPGLARRVRGGRMVL